MGLGDRNARTESLPHDALPSWAEFCVELLFQKLGDLPVVLFPQDVDRVDGQLHREGDRLLGHVRALDANSRPRHRASASEALPLSLRQSQLQNGDIKGAAKKKQNAG